MWHNILFDGIHYNLAWTFSLKLCGSELEQIFFGCFKSSFQLNSNSNKKLQKIILAGSLLMLWYLSLQYQKFRKNL